MTHRYLWFVATATAAAAAVAAGCSARPPESETPQAIQQRVTLEGFPDCGALERYVEDTAVRQMRLQLDAIKDGGWVFGGPAEADSSGGGTRGNDGPAAYTTTNTQVKGVDEADFVKNDGTRIFVLSGNRLFATRSWPARELSLAGSLPVEGWPQEMFLDENKRIVVMSYVWLDDARGGGGGGASPAADLCAPGWGCGFGGGATKLTVIDASDLAAMRVTDEYWLPGGYTGSRRVGSSVRVVLSDSFRWPEGVRFWPDYRAGGPDWWNDKAALAAELDRLKAANERIIRGASLAQWLPGGKRRIAGGRVVDLGYRCSDFHATNAPTQLGLVTVATLDLDAGARDGSGDGASAIARTSVVAQPGTIYASTSALYVASGHWWWWPEPGQVDWTYVHKFDLTDPSRVRYVASGGVAGHVVDQFALDEHRGYLRVATTISTRVQQEGNRWGAIETTNRLHVLGERAGALTLVGQTPELAKGERIFSARFVGDRGFVVTFRQVDPLFTFDLSDPRSPRAVGELKVPGFSTYIHPIDENHLLTMGVYLPDPGEGGQVDWRERRLKLSLFDVTDFAHPREAFSQLVGTAYGWSEANHEHKAFNYFAQRGLLAIPFSDWDTSVAGDDRYWDRFVSELRVFHVDVEHGITPRGALSLKDLYVGDGGAFGGGYSPWIRRSVMAADRDGTDYVYALSDAGIRVADLARLDAPLATVEFPAPRP